MWRFSEEHTDHSWCDPGHPDVHREVGWYEILLWSDARCTITRIWWSILPRSYRGTRTSGLQKETLWSDIMVTTFTIKRFTKEKPSSHRVFDWLSSTSQSAACNTISALAVRLDKVCLLGRLKREKHSSTPIYGCGKTQWWHLCSNIYTPYWKSTCVYASSVLFC